MLQHGLFLLKEASLSMRIFLMPAKLAILMSISRISLLAMFFLMPSISSSCIMLAFSFCSLWTECGASGRRRPSSSSFRPLDTRLRCFLPAASSNSGKLAWKLLEERVAVLILGYIF